MIFCIYFYSFTLGGRKSEACCRNGPCCQPNSPHILI